MTDVEIGERYSKLKVQFEDYGDREGTEAQANLLQRFIDDMFGEYFTHEQCETFLESAEETMEGLQ